MNRPVPTRYKIDISYDGTNYSGWQKQPNRKTVQGEIERLFAELFCERKVRIEPAGRTDAGVHARAQVAHLDLNNPVDPGVFKHALNSRLDRDIRILAVKKVPADFHARFSASKKEYRYFIYNGAVMPPTRRLYWLQEARKLDTGRMRAAAELLVGEYNFAPFSVNPKYEQKRCTVRTIHAFYVHKHGADITLTVQGNGFLYKMVRSLVGFLIRVGTGRLEPEAACRLLERGKRTAVVPTAKPHGLFLWKVFYPMQTRVRVHH